MDLSEVFGYSHLFGIILLVSHIIHIDIRMLSQLKLINYCDRRFCYIVQT